MNISSTKSLRKRRANKRKFQASTNYCITFQAVRSKISTHHDPWIMILWDKLMLSMMQMLSSFSVYHCHCVQRLVIVRWSFNTIDSTRRRMVFMARRARIHSKYPIPFEFSERPMYIQRIHFIRINCVCDTPNTISVVDGFVMRTTAKIKVTKRYWIFVIKTDIEWKEFQIFAWIECRWQFLDWRQHKWWKLLLSELRNELKWRIQLKR